MRKMTGLLLAVALVAAMCLLASPAGAAAGTACKTSTGKGTFNPPLPKIGDKKLVKTVLTATGKLTGCVGGGVTGGTTKTVSSKSAGSNCTTQATSKAPTKATETITWSNKQTSTVALTLSPVKGKPNTTKAVSGTVSAGLFKGLHQKGQIQYTLPKGACKNTTLATVTFKSLVPPVFK